MVNSEGFFLTAWNASAVLILHNGEVNMELDGKKDSRRKAMNVSRLQNDKVLLSESCSVFMFIIPSGESAHQLLHAANQRW